MPEKPKGDGPPSCPTGSRVENPIPKLPVKPKPDEPPIPPEIQKLIQPRAGLCQLLLQRAESRPVWSAFVAKGDFASVPAPGS